MKYRFLDKITSDVMFEAYGNDMKELLSNAAEALMSVVCEIDEVEAKEFVEFDASGENGDELMINWLQAVIALVDTEEMFFKKFEIKEIKGNSVKAVAYGEPITPAKSGTVVKAVTYYKFKMEKTEDGLKATVSLDI